MLTKNSLLLKMHLSQSYTQMRREVKKGINPSLTFQTAPPSVTWPEPSGDTTVRFYDLLQNSSKVRHFIYSCLQTDPLKAMVHNMEDEPGAFSLWLYHPSLEPKDLQNRLHLDQTYSAWTTFPHLSEIPAGVNPRSTTVVLYFCLSLHSSSISFRGKDGSLCHLPSA